MLMAPPRHIRHDAHNNQQKTVHPERRGNSRQGLDSGLEKQPHRNRCLRTKALMREPGHAVR